MSQTKGAQPPHAESSPGDGTTTGPPDVVPAPTAALTICPAPTSSVQPGRRPRRRIASTRERTPDRAVLSEPHFGTLHEEEFPFASKTRSILRATSLSTDRPCSPSRASTTA